MRIALVSVLIFISHISIGQQKKLDSLLQVLEAYPQNDTLKVQLLITISIDYWVTDPPQMKHYAEQALALAKKLGYVKGMGDAYREIGRYYWSQSDYKPSIDYSLLAIEEYEKCHSTIDIARCLGTIGLGYTQAKLYDKSIEYHARALGLNQQIGYQTGIARDLNNLGIVYELSDENLKALEYYQKALDMRLAIGEKSGIYYPLSNVGCVYLNLGDYAKARQYFMKSLDLAKELQNKPYLTVAFEKLGETAYKSGRYTEAEDYLQQSLSIALAIGDKKRREETYLKLKTLEELRGNFKSALRYEHLLKDLRDSIYSQEKTFQLATLEKRSEMEKKEQAILLLDKDRKIQVLWRNMAISAVFVLLVVFIAIYWWLRYEERNNLENLHRQIVFLTGQNHDLAQKYHQAMIKTEAGAMLSLDQSLLNKALKTVEDNLADPLFGVEKMALEMGMSRANLHRKLKTLTGFAPIDFIRNVRLERAANMLQHNTDTVSQVAYKVGFEDQSYFSKVFKKRFRVSPSDYNQPVLI